MVRGTSRGTGRKAQVSKKAQVGRAGCFRPQRRYLARQGTQPSTAAKAQAAAQALWHLRDTPAPVPGKPVRAQGVVPGGGGTGRSREFAGMMVGSTLTPNY